MRRSIEPFREFLGTTPAMIHHTYIALEYAGQAVTRLDAGNWPLEPAADIDPQEVLRAIQAVHGTSVRAIKIVSSAELMESQLAGRATLTKLVTIEGDTLIGAIKDVVEVRMGPELDKRFEQAMMQVLDPNGTGEGPPTEMMEKMPLGTYDAPLVGLFCSFIPVAAASINDQGIFDRVIALAKLVQRCLPFGYEDATRETILVLTA
jgi:hypothetical protein